MSFMLHKWLSALTDGQVVEMKWTVLIFQPEICLLIHIGHILKVSARACLCLKGVRICIAFRYFFFSYSLTHTPKGLPVLLGIVTLSSVTSSSEQPDKSQ